MEEMAKLMEALMAEQKNVPGPEPLATSTPRSDMCPTCQGHGWFVLDVEIDHPDFGKKYPCKCQQEHVIEQYLKYSGIPEMNRADTFDSFERLPGTSKIYNAALELANPDSPVRLVIGYGGTGSGKTHLGYAIAIESIKRLVVAQVVNARSWLDEIKAAVSASDHYLASALKANPEHVLVLILDEFEWKTDTDIEWLDKLVTTRFDRGRRTYITTNRDAKDLERTFPRIHSRATDEACGRLVLNIADDYRPPKQEG